MNNVDKKDRRGMKYNLSQEPYKNYKAISQLPTKGHTGGIANFTMKLDFLVKSVKMTEVNKAIEVGFNVGHSAAVILNNIPETSEFYSIDINMVNAVTILQNEFQNFHFIKNRSEDALKAFDEGEIDFIFIDGNHQYEYVKTDSELSVPLIRSGGYILYDDTHQFWVVDAIKASKYYDRLLLQEEISPKLVRCCPHCRKNLISRMTLYRVK